MPSQVHRKNMEEMQLKNSPRTSSKVPALNVDDLKNKKHSHSHKNVSPLIPTSGAATKKSSSGRWDCLCSPTTHAGSFRCRRHRADGLMRRAGSVGSNLSALESKDSSLSSSPSPTCLTPCNSARG